MAGLLMFGVKGAAPKIASIVCLECLMIAIDGRIIDVWGAAPKKALLLVPASSGDRYRP